MSLATVPASRHVELFEIGAKMKRAGLPDQFIADAVRTAQEFEGVYDLMVLWRDERSKTERELCIADIQDLIDDTAQQEKRVGPVIKFNDLEAVAKDIRAFKDSLLMMVNEHGGLSKLAKETGIPLPSLSRLFNSGSMPRRVTLLKIANALRTDAIQVSAPWVRRS